MKREQELALSLNPVTKSGKGHNPVTKSGKGDTEGRLKDLTGIEVEVCLWK